MKYDQVGTGVPLLLIHGFPLDRTMWQPQLDGLQDVAHVIAPDLRGFGGSEDGASSMTMSDYAFELKALLDEMNIKQAVVCGLSMGGYIALAMLADHPDVVKGLILCNTRPTADDSKAVLGRHAMAHKAADEGMAGIAEVMLPKLLSDATHQERRELSSAVREMITRQRSGGVGAALRGMATRSDRSEMLEEITVPTLIITGSKDPMIPPSASEAMAAMITGSKLVVIPDVAHLSNLEAPDAFNNAIREFMLALPA